MYDPRAEPSPLAYYVAKDAKPENWSAGTVRTFLGIRLECAQCHKHPFDHWEPRNSGAWPPSSRASRSRGKTTLSVPIRETADRPRLRFPKPKKIVKAAFLIPPSPSGQVGERSQFWPTGSLAPDNPYFARAAVNRVRARFSTGIVEPVDDLPPTTRRRTPSFSTCSPANSKAARLRPQISDPGPTATKTYALNQCHRWLELAAANLFAAMPVRTLSSGQLFETIAAGDRLPRRLSERSLTSKGPLKSRFVELFTNRDEKPDRRRDVDPPVLLCS